MSDKKIFSKHYSTDTTKYEDKEKFRNRILKYLEDFVNQCWPGDTYRLCRTEMGIDLKYTQDERRKRNDMHVEQTFYNSTVSEILDFITVVYDSLIPHLQNQAINMQEKLEKYIKDINRIFREESMCYVLNDSGRIRYYPDEEFQQLAQQTLKFLGEKKYSYILSAFNMALDDLYRNPNTESPVENLFDTIETFVLSMLNDKKFKMLNDSSIDSLMNIINAKIQSDGSHSSDDIEAVSKMRNIFSNWVSMCHKYRHGKAAQINKNVPSALFNLIFSTGISVFRFLLEIDNKYNIIKN